MTHLVCHYMCQSIALLRRVNQNDTRLEVDLAEDLFTTHVIVTESVDESDVERDLTHRLEPVAVPRPIALWQTRVVQSSDEAELGPRLDTEKPGFAGVTCYIHYRNVA